MPLLSFLKKFKTRYRESEENAPRREGNEFKRWNADFLIASSKSTVAPTLNFSNVSQKQTPDRRNNSPESSEIEGVSLLNAFVWTWLGGRRRMKRLPRASSFSRSIRFSLSCLQTLGGQTVAKANARSLQEMHSGVTPRG